jgi:hypothetical protein
MAIFMPKSSRLLRRAYDLVHDNRIDDAALVLDAVVQEDPQNVEAWELYLQISQTVDELEWLGHRIRTTKQLSAVDREAIMSYQEYLLRGLDAEAGKRAATMRQKEWSSAVAVLAIAVMVGAMLRSQPALAGGLISVLFIGWLFYRSTIVAPALNRYGLRARRFAGDIRIPKLKRRRPRLLDPDADRPILVMNEPIIEIGPEHRSVIKTRSITMIPPRNRIKMKK